MAGAGPHTIELAEDPLPFITDPVIIDGTTEPDFAGTPVVAPFLMMKRGKIEEGKFDVEFPLQWMHKDLQLASDTAYETGTVVPSGNIAKEIFGLAMRAGLGEQDFSAVYTVLAGRK
jgi:hypothetical protein